MKAFASRCISLGLATLLAACAVPQPQDDKPQPPFRDPAMTVEGAAGISTPGRTKQEIAALLGPAVAVRLDSGHEVWVYRPRPPKSRPTEDQPELVVLFSPSGVVEKSRVRPAYPRAAP